LYGNRASECDDDEFVSETRSEEDGLDVNKIIISLSPKEREELRNCHI